MKKLDLFLALVIVTSVATIAWRQLRNDSSSERQAAQGQILGAALQTQVPLVVEPRAPYWILGRLSKVTESDWGRALEHAGDFGRRVSVSSGCAGNQGLSRAYINHTVRLYAQRMAELQNNVLLSIGDEVCHRTGDTIAILSFDSNPDSPLVEYLGSIKIRDILMIMPREVTDSFMAIMGPTKQEYFEYLEAVDRRLDRPDTVLHFEQASLAKLDLTQAPPTFPNTRIFKYSEAKELADSGRAVLIDVRSPQEFGKKSVSGTMNVPYTIASQPQSGAVFAKKKSEFGKASFDIAGLLGAELRARQLIVVGNGPRDVRPVLALYELWGAGKTRLAWVHEGVPAN